MKKQVEGLDQSYEQNRQSIEAATRGAEASEQIAQLSESSAKAALQSAEANERLVHEVERQRQEAAMPYIVLSDPIVDNESTSDDFVYLTFEARNIGSGPAINIQVKLYNGNRLIADGSRAFVSVGEVAQLFVSDFLSRDIKEYANLGEVVLTYTSVSGHRVSSRLKTYCDFREYEGNTRTFNNLHAIHITSVEFYVSR